MQYIIGIDIGTSGTKAIAFTVTGEVTGNAYVSYEPLQTPANHHEQDPETLFKAVLTSLEEVLRQTRSNGELLGVCFSSAMHSVIALDDKGNPLTNVITWVDQRSTKYAQALKNTEAGKRIYQHTGTPVHPMSPLCKLMWMKGHEPDLFTKTHKFISIKEYIFYRLTGQYLVDYSIASGTGLFDIATKNWYEDSLCKAGVTANQLSKPVNTTHKVQTLKKEYCNQLSIDEATPFIVGASDGCLANLGSNAVKPGDLAVTIGTSGAVRMISEHPHHDEQERIFNYILTEHLFVSGGPINNGMLLLKWYAEKFLLRTFTSGKDMEWFVSEAAKAPAGSAGLIFLPYLQGERAPVWDAMAKGVFFGVHSGHGQAHFMRAIIEGINYALYQVAESVQDTVGAIREIHASGGFIRSKLWLQWLTDLFGKEVAVCNKADASAIGAGLLGLQAVGVLGEGESLPAFNEDLEYFKPNSQYHDLYQKYYAVYKSLYPDLKDRLHALHDINQL